MKQLTKAEVSSCAGPGGGLFPAAHLVVIPSGSSTERNTLTKSSQCTAVGLPTFYPGITTITATI